MGAMQPLRGALGMLTVGVVAGCSSVGSPGPEEHCTLQGCSDQLLVTMTFKDEAVPTGMQVLTATADGVELSCTFPLPAEDPTGFGVLGPSCQEGLNLFTG